VKSVSVRIQIIIIKDSETAIYLFYCKCKASLHSHWVASIVKLTTFIFSLLCFFSLERSIQLWLQHYRQDCLILYNSKNSNLWIFFLTFLIELSTGLWLIYFFVLIIRLLVQILFRIFDLKKWFIIRETQRIYIVYNGD